MREVAERRAKAQERPYFGMKLSERNPGPGNLGKDLGGSEPDLGRGWHRDGEEEGPEAPDGCVSGGGETQDGAAGTSSWEESVEQQDPEPGRQVVRTLELRSLSEN